MSSETALGVVEGLVLRPGARDVAALAVPVLGSAVRLSQQLLTARASGRLHVGLVTGAYMAWPENPGAETDGPVGAAALACLYDMLDIPVTLITDDLCADVVTACLEQVPVRAKMEIVPHDATPDYVRSAGETWSLSHLTAIERLGPGSDGRVRTMRGLDNSEFTAPLHVLFQDAGAMSSAIGDGGNEIGMGLLPVSLISEFVEDGQRIACRTPVENLIVAGTSNWGCYGLIATLAILERQCLPTALALLSPAADRRLIGAALSAGAVDGVTGSSEFSVDGVSVRAYEPMLRALMAIIDGG